MDIDKPNTLLGIIEITQKVFNIQLYVAWKYPNNLQVVLYFIMEDVEYFVLNTGLYEEIELQSLCVRVGDLQKRCNRA